MDEQKKQPSTNSQTALDKTLQILGVVFKIAGSVIAWCFFASLFIMGTLFWLLDKWLGDGRNPVRAPWDKPRFNQQQFRKELQSSTAEEVLKQFGKELEELEKGNQLDSNERQVVRKLKGLDRSKLRSQMREAFSNDEIEILFLLLLKLLSGY